MTTTYRPDYGSGPAGVAAGQAEAWIRADHRLAGRTLDRVTWTNPDGEDFESIGLSSHEALTLAKDLEFNTRFATSGAVDNLKLVLGSGRVLDAAAIRTASY